MPRSFFLFFCCGVSLYATVSLEYISTKPQSRARDFLIWEYLQHNDITPQKAKKVYKLVKNKNNPKIKKLYAKIVDDAIRYELQCKKRKDLLKIEDDRCLNFAFSPYKTIKMSRFQRDQLLTRNLSMKNKKILQLQNEPCSFVRYREYDPDDVTSFLLTLPRSVFQSKFDKKLKKNDIEFLMCSLKFDRFVVRVVTDYSLKNLQRSLFSLSLKRLNSKSAFFLALNAVRYNQKKSAIRYLKTAYAKAKKQRERDKINFWLYLVSGDTLYLKNLLLSMSINIYTLYAHEKTNVEVVNYFNEVDTVAKKSSYNLQNPFDWLYILDTVHATKRSELFRLIRQQYKYEDLAPVQCFVIERAYNYKMHGYISPYDKYLKKLSKQQKAFFYSLMRQESTYIPSAISRSFAVGLMQLMPFLIDHIAKKKQEKIISFTQLFDPEKNIQYAKIHLKWLQKVLDENPLFIAYAYNGGYGFFSRYKKSGRFLQGKYEPFLSMEMMANTQTREYGKRVLANYVMYMKIYGEKFSLIGFFESLK